MADLPLPTSSTLADLLLASDARRADIERACRAHGFSEPGDAARMLAQLAQLPAPDAVLRAAIAAIPDAVAATGHPQSALTAVYRLAVNSPEPEALVNLVASDARAAGILAALGMASPFLSEMLSRRPQALADLLEPGALDSSPSRQRLEDALRRALGSGEGCDAARAILRRFKRSEILRIAARDLLGLATFEDTVAELSDLACALLQAALDTTTADLRARHGTPRDGDAEARFAVVALGKLGGRELNYSSDLDVMFVHSGDGQCDAPPGMRRSGRTLTNQEHFDRLASAVVQAMQEPTEEGIVWRVDTRLRPEGAAGHLSRSLGGCISYYESWAEPWERQALIKASYAAGDEPLAERFLSAVRPFVYGRRLDALGLADVRAMRERIEPTGDAAPDALDVKVGPGGIRDIEFAVQALQLVAGADDEAVRRQGTLPALRALVEGGHISAATAGRLRESYVFLRTLEHRLQLVHDQPVHRLPSERDALVRLSHSMGHASPEELLDRLRACMSGTRRIFDDVFRRLTSGADTPSDEERLVLAPALPDEEARQILQAHGISDLAVALRTLRWLALGPAHAHVSEKAQRQFARLVPRILDAASCSAEPDLCVSNLGRFVSMLGSWSALYESLERNDEALHILCRVAGFSPFLSDVLARHPEFLDALLDPDVMGDVKSAEQLKAEAAERLRDAEALPALRRFRRRELLRIGVRHLMGHDDIGTVMLSVSDVADAVTAALLQHCEDALISAHGAPIGLDGRPIGFAIIGLGKLGGRELHYSSDLDVMFVYGGDGDTDGPDPVTAHQFFTRLAESVLRRSGELTPDGRLFPMDVRLRAEGARGSIVMPLAGYVDYCYDRAQTWERLALTRARYVAGDADLARQLLTEIEPFVFAGLTRRELESLRQMKERIESERARPDTDEQMDIKLGAGGITDVEFIVQALQLQHGQERPDICKPNTSEAIEALRRAGLMSDERASTLSRAYEFLRAVECAVQIAREEAAQVIDLRQPELAKLARRMAASGQPDLTADALRQRLTEERAVVRELFEETFAAS